jgi:hypothetical protein
MGKSDSLIFPVYESMLEDKEYSSIAFLGFSQENDFTRKTRSRKRDFYDLHLGNWNINQDWTLKQQYELIVCTRCAYFAKDPKVFIEKCRSHLEENGQALIDWGLGDHWRFEKYKVGWVRDGEHEHAYEKDNYLYSCYWDDSLLEEKEVQDYWQCVTSKNWGYDSSESMSHVVKREVPNLLNYKPRKITTKFLWPERPQLYIVTLF